MLEIVVLALATWRLTALLVWEDGPFEVFAKLRYFFGVRYDEQSQPYGTNWFAKGVVCHACASVWFGTAWGVAYLIWPQVWWVALPFALSAGAIALERWNNG